MSLREIHVALLTTLLLNGCSTPWRAVELPPDSWPRLRQQFEVWTDGRVRVLHAVRVSANSLSGVPFFRAPECDSCRVAIPLPEIDSLRTGNKMEGLARTVGLVMGVELVAMIAMCNAFGCPVRD
jgi:hypothetical protein